MDDRVCFVQFLHPGGEHGSDHGTVKAWNVGPHQRKFMRSPGRYVDNRESRDSEIVFWGEWEAQSMVETIDKPLMDGPRWTHRPICQLPDSYRDRQNTDPFVFGPRFQYTGCLQHTKVGPTQLRNLNRGSVILFGSCRRRSAFVLDTAFVVADYIDHCKRDFAQKLQGRISGTYHSVTISPWYTNMVQRDRVYRLSSGATFSDPGAGMFSFFPCLPTGDDPSGFARPQIIIPGVITPNQTQNKKMTCVSDMGATQSVVGRGRSSGQFARTETRHRSRASHL